MTWSALDHVYMARAIQLAKRGHYTTAPNPRVGCVLAQGDTIIAESWHQKAGTPHAEIQALQQLTHPVPGLSCYITLEPCTHYGRTPPCVDELIQAKIGRAIIAMPDPNPQVMGQGIKQLRQANIQTDQGLMEKEAQALNPGFIRRMESGLPFVRCKLAMSLDGRTALASGESQWITSKDARRDVHRLRAESAAIITGVGTILADNPSLNVRDFDKTHQQPLRVIIDSTLKTPADSKILTTAGRTIIMTQETNADHQHRLQQAGAEIVVLKNTGEAPWLEKILRYLAQHEAINDILVESGRTLGGSFLQAGLIDELILYIAPKLLGHDAEALLNLCGVTSLNNCPQFSILDVRQIGTDIRIQGHFKNGIGG